MTSWSNTSYKKFTQTWGSKPKSSATTSKISAPLVLQTPYHHKWLKWMSCLSVYWKTLMQRYCKIAWDWPQINVPTSLTTSQQNLPLPKYTISSSRVIKKTGRYIPCWSWRIWRTSIIWLYQYCQDIDQQDNVLRLLYWFCLLIYTRTLYFFCILYLIFGHLFLLLILILYIVLVVLLYVFCNSIPHCHCLLTVCSWFPNIWFMIPGEIVDSTYYCRDSCLYFQVILNR